MSSEGVKVVLVSSHVRKPFRVSSTDSFDSNFLPSVRDRFGFPYELSDINLSYIDTDTNEQTYVSCQGDFQEFVNEAKRGANNGKVVEMLVEIEQNAIYNAQKKNGNLSNTSTPTSSPKPSNNVKNPLPLTISDDHSIPSAITILPPSASSSSSLSQSQAIAAAAAVVTASLNRQTSGTSPSPSPSPFPLSSSPSSSSLPKSVPLPTPIRVPDSVGIPVVLNNPHSPSNRTIASSSSSSRPPLASGSGHIGINMNVNSSSSYTIPTSPPAARPYGSTTSSALPSARAQSIIVTSPSMNGNQQAALLAANKGRTGGAGSMNQKNNLDVSRGSISLAPPVVHRASSGSVTQLTPSKTSEAAKKSFSPQDSAKWSEIITKFNQCVTTNDVLGAVQAGTQLIQMDNQNVDVLYNLGAAHSTLGNWTSAVDSYSKCVQLQTDHALAYLGRGNAYAALGNLQSAIIDHTRASTIEPMNAQAHHSLAVACSQMSKYDQAAQAEQRAINVLERDPNACIIYELDISECYYAYGWNMARLGNAEEAISSYGKALAVTPRMTKALSSRGNVFRNLGDWKKAQSDFQRSCDIDGSSSKGWHDLAMCCHRTGELQRAIEADTKSINIHPSFSAYFNRSIAYASLGMWKEALNDVNAALKMDPRHAGALCNRGVILAAMGDMVGAMADWDASIGISPTPTALNARALANWEAGNFDAALRDWDTSIGISPTYDALLHRANHYLAQGKPEEAIKDYDMAISLVPENAASSALCNRAAAHCLLGNYNKAIQDCDKAILHNPQLGQAYYNRGLALAGMEKYEKALEDHKKAAMLDPNNVVYGNAVQAAQHAVNIIKENKDSMDRKNAEEQLKIMRAKILGEEDEKNQKPIDYNNFAPLSAEQARQLAMDEGLTAEEMEYLQRDFGPLLEKLRKDMAGLKGKAMKDGGTKEEREILEGKLRLTPEMRTKLAEYRARVAKYPVLKRWKPLLAACLDTSTYQFKQPQKKLAFAQL